MWRPNWSVDREVPRRLDEHPGEILVELLKERDLKQTDLCRATGYSPKHINQIIQGKVGITPEFALCLEESLDNPSAEFWCRAQCDYDLWILRSNTMEEADYD